MIFLVEEKDDMHVLIAVYYLTSTLYSCNVQSKAKIYPTARLKSIVI